MVAKIPAMPTAGLAMFRAFFSAISPTYLRGPKPWCRDAALPAARHGVVGCGQQACADVAQATVCASTSMLKMTLFETTTLPFSSVPLKLTL